MRFRNTKSLLWLVCAVLFLLGCTDYIEQINEQMEEIEAHEKLRVENSISESEVVVDSSSVFEGTLEDDRDGQVYRTVTIGTQTWMAENLNFDVTGSYCYDDESSNCEEYGRLYTWSAAMDSAAIFSSNGKGCGKGKICFPTYPVRGVCPSGWHLPSYGDWSTLLSAVDYDRFMVSDVKLKSKSGWQEEWHDGTNMDGNGSDEYAFSIIPSGAKIVNGKYYYKGTKAYFWLSTEQNRDYAENYYVGSKESSYLSDDYKQYAFSVRCVKDVVEEKPEMTSSSETPESSSSAESSSSQKPSSSADGVTSFLDERDGTVYKMVTIGDQVWMAENLKYEVDSSFCFMDKPINCSEFGRLYTWNAAKDVCPDGWHLPAYAEFETLISTVGGEDVAGKMLKSKDGWLDGLFDDLYISGNGTDAYGFYALPAGKRRASAGCDGFGNCVGFWSSTEIKGLDSDRGEAAYYMYLNTGDKTLMFYGYSDEGLYVRCVKGEPQENPPMYVSSPSSSGASSSASSSSSEENDKSSSSEKTAYSSSEESSSSYVYSSSGESSSSNSSSSYSYSSSSNAAYVEPCKVEVEYEPSKTSMEDNCEYGTLTDERDGQTYGTVKIGTQTWMTENLNYEIENSFCFGGGEGPCAGYGRLYYWSMAMDSAGICPSGWHLPSKEEFEMLVNSVGGSDIAGEMLKSTQDWSRAAGIDAYGFNAYPMGGMSDHESYWSSTETGDDGAYILYFDYGTSAANLIDESKTEGLSVRCLMD